MDIGKKVLFEDLEEDDRELAELIGVENFIKLVQNYGGGSIYLKKLETVTRKVRDREIKSKFTGFNYSELAREYRLSEKMVRNIIDEDSLKKLQISIFDYK